MVTHILIDKSSPPPPFQAESSQNEIRSSFDDSSAPLLQHEDRENQYSTVSNVQLDLQ